MLNRSGKIDVVHLVIALHFTIYKMMLNYVKALYFAYNVISFGTLPKLEKFYKTFDK